MPPGSPSAIPWMPIPTLIAGSAITSQGTITSETPSGLAVNIGTIPGGNYTVTLSFKVTINARRHDRHL